MYKEKRNFPSVINVPITCPLQVNMIKDDGMVIHFTNPKGNSRNLLN